MKVLAVLFALAAVASAALLPGYPLDGRYYPDDSGRYIVDSSGQYIPDNSGAYIDDGSGRYDGDRGDNGGQYKHTPDVFGPGDGQYSHQASNVEYSGYVIPVPSQPLDIIRPPKTYLPIPEPSPSIPTIVVSPPTFVPQPVKPVSGNYKWTLVQSGDHDVENPHYRLNVALPAK